MMPTSTPWSELIESIHASGRKLVVAITGGGSSAIADLLEIPGGSKSVFEAIVPYSPVALQRFLNFQPEHACSQLTARAMAMAAWRRAQQFAPPEKAAQLVGIGCSASLASSRPKRGDHRIHVAWQSAAETVVVSLELEKDTRSRQQEEAIAAKLVLLAIGEATGCELEAARRDVADQLHPSEAFVRTAQRAEASWAKLLLGEARWSVAMGKVDIQPQVIFPGSFNPMHQGHCQMAEVAARRLGAPVVLEISITNADKPPIDFLEIAARLRSVRKQNPHAQLILTEAPTFVEKATLFPGCTFVVGADTMQRITDRRFYSDGSSELSAAIVKISELGCRFLVFGREFDGSYHTLGDLSVPPTLLALCDQIPQEEFRLDISSTELRTTK